MFLKIEAEIAHLKLNPKWFSRLLVEYMLHRMILINFFEEKRMIMRSFCFNFD